MERLFSLLSDCMWEAPIAQAKHSIQIKEKVQELKLQVCKQPSPFLTRCVDKIIGLIESL